MIFYGNQEPFEASEATLRLLTCHSAPDFFVGIFALTYFLTAGK